MGQRSPGQTAAQEAEKWLRRSRSLSPGAPRLLPPSLAGPTNSATNSDMGAPRLLTPQSLAGSPPSPQTGAQRRCILPQQSLLNESTSGPPTNSARNSVTKSGTSNVTNSGTNSGDAALLLPRSVYICDTHSHTHNTYACDTHSHIHHTHTHTTRHKPHARI